MILKGFYVLSFLAVVGFCIASFVLLGRERKVDRFVEKVRKMEKVIDPEFNKIKKYYINLDRSVDRRDYMEEQIERLGIENIERVPGVDGKKANSTEEGKLEDFKYKISYTKRKVKKGEIGCILSHFKAIRKSYENGDEYAIIFEDDILLDMSKVWNFKFSEIIEKVDSQMEIINLSTNTVPSRNKPLNLEEYNPKKRSSWTCSYLITRKGMEKIFRLTESLEIIFDSDLVADVYLYEKLTTRVLRPSIFIPDAKNNNSYIRTYDYYNQFSQWNYKLLKYGKYI